MAELERIDTLSQSAAGAADVPESAPSFTGYDGIIDMLHKEADGVKVMTPEERAAERRRAERRRMMGGIADVASALSRLIAAHNYAPYVAPQGPSLSEREAERYERLLARDEGNRGRRLELLGRAAQLGTERDRLRYGVWRDKEAAARAKEEMEYRRERDKVADDRWQRQYDDSRRDRGEDVSYRNQVFEYQQKNDNAQLAQGWSRISMERAQHQQQAVYTLAAGGGMDPVRIPVSALNAQTVSYLHSLLPESARAKAQLLTKGVYEQPSTEEQLARIGEYLSRGSGAEADALRQALRSLAGERVEDDDLLPPSKRK